TEIEEKEREERRARIDSQVRCVDRCLPLLIIKKQILTRGFLRREKPKKQPVNQVQQNVEQARKSRAMKNPLNLRSRYGKDHIRCSNTLTEIGSLIKRTFSHLGLQCKTV